MIGIDEVGRGCWAGPLLIVAARQAAELPRGLKDSKLLTKNRREQLAADIRLCCELGEGWVSAEEIDKWGLAEAMRVGVARALKVIDADSSEQIIMDGTVNYCDAQFTHVHCQAKADNLYPIVSAASIYAKVTRDAFMAQQDLQFPEYGFGRHVGYGTKEHSEALKVHGVSSLHRLSFTPIKTLAGL